MSEENVTPEGDPNAGGQLTDGESSKPMVQGGAPPSLLGAQAETAAPDGEDGRPGWCKEKFWDAEKKAVNIEALAKGHASLERMLGAHTGAPEQYDTSKWIPEDAPEGSTIDTDSMEFKAFTEAGKKYGVNDEAMAEFARIYTASVLGNEQGYINSQIEAMGENGQEMLQQISDWAATAAPPELAEQVTKGCNNAHAALAIKGMIEMIQQQGNVPVRPKEGEIADGSLKGMTREEVFERDWDKYYSDPTYRDRVDARVNKWFALNGGHPGNLPAGGISHPVEPDGS